MSRLIVLTALIAFLASCGESSLLTPELSEDEQVQIETVADGALVASTGSVPVSVRRRTPDGSTSDPLGYMDVTVADAAGTVVATTRVEREPLEADDIPPIALPDLDPGRYLITFAIYRDGELVAERERTLFVVADPGAYTISGIATYPPSLAPSRRGVAQASVTAPAGSRSFLRWRLEGEVIHEGYLSDGADQVTLEAPEASGAYALSLELFPHGRPSARYQGPAPVRQQTRLFVRSAGAAADRALGPRESYFALFHFDGSAEDSGVGGEVTGGRGVEAEPVGTVELRVSDRLFGYELDGSSGFEVSGLIVPFRGAALSQFSLNARLRADELSGTRRILSLNASDADLGLSLTVNESGLPALELRSAAETAQSAPREPLFAVGEPLDLSVAVLPGSDGTRVKWYADGRFVSESRLPVGFVPPDPDAEWRRRPGVTRIGGENGFVGIVDELGVYFRDDDGEPAVYTDMYRDARRRELGSTLVYAEGFDTAGIPEDTAGRGAVRVEQGILVLGAESVLQVPALPFNGDVIIVEIDSPQIPGAPPVRVSFGDGERALFSVDARGRLVDWRGRELSVAAGNPLRLRLVRGEGGISVSVGADAVTVPLRTEELGELSMRLRGPAESGSARVESVLAYHEAERVAAAEQEPASEEEAMP